MTARRVPAALTLQPGELRRVLIMIIYSAAAMGGVLTLGLAASEALFLSHLPASDIAYAFILPAAAIIPALYVYNRLSQHIKFDRLIIASNLILLLIIGLFRVLLGTDAGKSLPVLGGYYLTTELGYTLVILQFWVVAGRVFNVREAKRLFGLIALGGTLANILIGLSMGTLAKWIGVENFLIVVMLSLAVCAACVWRITRSIDSAPSGSASAAAQTVKHSSFKQDLRALWQSPLLRAIGGLTLLLALVINISAYMFLVALQIEFSGHPIELAATLGNFEFLAGIAAIFVQFYLTPRILRRFGVLAALLFLPLGTLLLLAITQASGGALLALLFLRALDPILRRTITTAALGVLYLPIEPDLRDRAREVFEILYAIAFGVFGLFVLLLQSIPAITLLSYVIPVGVLCGVWLALLRWTKPHYRQTLMNSLKKRTLDLAQAPIDLNDETTVRVLIDALKNPDPLYVLHALNLMEVAANIDWSEHIAPLLDHPSMDVRIEALKHLGQRGRAEHAETIEQMLDSPHTALQAAAIEAYCALAGSQSTDRILPYLSVGPLDTQSAAIIGLSRYGDEDARSIGVVQIDGWLNGDDLIRRCEAVRLIGLLPQLDRSHLLIDLWKDPQRPVKLAALRAAAQIRTPEFIPELIEALADVRVSDTAASALAHYGAAIEPELQRVLSDANFDRAVRAKIPTVLRRLATAGSAEILIAHLADPDQTVRAAVEVALAMLHSDQPEISVPPEKVRQAVLSEVQDTYALFVMEQDLTLERSDLLADTFQARRLQMLDRALRLLNMLYPHQKIDRVYDALRSKHSSARASALELLDNVLDNHTKEVLLPMIEAPAARVMALAQRRFNITRRSRSARLTELLNSGDNWLRACAIYQIGQLAQHDLSEPVRQALHEDDDVLRETALAAGRSLFEHTQYMQALREQSADDRFPVAQRYAREQLAT